MMPSHSVGTIIFKTFLGIQTLVSLFVMGAGIFYLQWYAGLGLLLFASSLFASLPVYFPPDKTGPVVKLIEGPVRTEVRFRRVRTAAKAV